MSDILLASLGRYVPECIASFTMVFLLYFEATYSDKDAQAEDGKSYIYIGATIGLVATLIALILNLGVAPTKIFTNSIVIDPFGTILKMVMVIATLALSWLSRNSRDIYPGLKSEFVILSIGVMVGGMLLVSAHNLLTLYLGIETLSILSYVMASLKKHDALSAEAGLKYTLYGGISAGIMLFGISYIYGITGSIQFSEIAPKLATLDPTSYYFILVSFLLFFAGLGFKIACVPFHMWSPDVYEGSPLPVTAFFSIVPKMAALGAIMRVALTFFGQEGGLQTSWIVTIQIIAALTMTVGNVTAIGQKSIKRMLAYSSISHAGFMLLGVLVLSDLGVSALLFYGITYLFMTLVAFMITSYVTDLYGNDHFERFSGLVKRYPFMAMAMAIVMFSLGGLPPFSGFVAKFNIISLIVAKKYYELAIIAVLNSVVSLYYYMRIVRLMMITEVESEEKIPGMNFLNQLIVCVLCVPVIVLGIFWSDLMQFVTHSKLFIN